MVAAGMAAWRLVSGQREHERLYGRARMRLRLRPPLRRIPGLPLDGVLTGQDEAVFDGLRRAFRQREGR
jgi:hypothetical protein